MLSLTEAASERTEGRHGVFKDVLQRRRNGARNGSGGSIHVEALHRVLRARAACEDAVEHARADLLAQHHLQSTNGT